VFISSISFITQLQHKIEKNEREFEFNPAVDDVYAISSLMKVGSLDIPHPTRND
jgi:hypothetical protein